MKINKCLVRNYTLTALRIWGNRVRKLHLSNFGGSVVNDATE